MSKLIEKEGRFYKECGVVMLGASKQTHQVEEGKIFINDSREHSWGKLQALRCERVTAHGHAWNGTGIQTYINHQYITSDDEIKNGNWIYEGDLKTINRVGENYIQNNFDKKIIATTDPELVICQCNGTDYHKMSCKTRSSLPSPSDKFIQAYIEAYNKGEKIEKVLVEWGNGCHCCEGSIDTCNQIQSRGHSLKVDCDTFRQPKLKDNNIIIKKVKDSWSKADLIKAICEYTGDSIGKVLPFVDKWIEENL